MNLRNRIEQVADLPPAAALVCGILVLAMIIGLVCALLLLPDPGRLRSPAARARARRGKESRKRQKRLRDRREALQRKASRR
ncbi:hypothetical protein [Streptomyces sp. NPDC057682]|uniref:hypothetical protein n=1 Tax=unclassified Streptomyces TaxID=2593676 RepID=UPI0036512953